MGYDLLLIFYKFFLVSNKMAKQSPTFDTVMKIFLDDKLQ